MPLRSFTRPPFFVRWPSIHSSIAPTQTRFGSELGKLHRVLLLCLARLQKLTQTLISVCDVIMGEQIAAAFLPCLQPQCPKGFGRC